MLRFGVVAMAGMPGSRPNAARPVVPVLPRDDDERLRLLFQLLVAPDTLLGAH